MFDIQICRRTLSKQYRSNYRCWFPRKKSSGWYRNYQTTDLGHGWSRAIPQVDGLTLLQKCGCCYFCIRRYLVSDYTDKSFLEFCMFSVNKVFGTSQNGSPKRTSIFCTQMFQDYLSGRRTIWKAKRWSDSVPKDLRTLIFCPCLKFLQRFVPSSSYNQEAII